MTSEGQAPGSREMQPMTMTSVGEYSSCFIDLQYFWKEKKRAEFTQQMKEYLSSSANPYLMAFINVKLCPDLFKSKQDSLAANILVELQAFMNQDSDAKNYESCVSAKLQKDVYDVAVRQKNTGMLKLLVKTFHLSQNGERFLPSLEARLKQGHYKEVCLLAVLLGLQSHFTTSELLVPLFLEDQLGCADDFLNSSPVHQKELVIFIDDIIGKKITMTDLLTYKIKDTKRLRSNKILSGILAKLLKKFGLDAALCPHFQKFRATGGLRYLFYKCYIEKSLQKSNFHSLVDESLQESPYVAMDLMNLFVDYCDPQGALPFVTKLQLQHADLPQQIREAVIKYPNLLEPSEFIEEARQSEQEDWDSEIESCQYYTLDIPQEEVVIIDSVEKFEECFKDLTGSPLLAIDTEWKPNFGVGSAEQASLLQFATPSKIFILDLLTLQNILHTSHWYSIGQLFSDASITKLGYGIRGDFKVLGSLHPKMKEGTIAAENVIDLDITKGILLEEHPKFFSHNKEVHKGLSDLVYRCFGLPLDKRDCFSNWSARPLTRSQVTYAALDVRCLINVYNYLSQKVTELHLPDWKTVKRRPNHPAKKPKPQSPVALVGKSTGSQGSAQWREPVRASDLRFVCDTMVQGLAKELRSCGVDAVALAIGEGFDHCLEYYQKEQRIVLTRGKPYQALTKHIPPQYLYNIKSETGKEQLAEIIETFKVKVTLSDVFARCRKCNSNEYLILPSSVFATLRTISLRGKENGKGNSESTVECHQVEQKGRKNGWVDCQGGRVNLFTGRTGSGVAVLAGVVPNAVIENTEEFYVCALCGKCYWMGSHHKKVLTGKLKNIVDIEDAAVEFMELKVTP